MNLLQWNENGLYCPPGDFYVDPKRRVPRAIITHAHSDHARRGCKSYLCSSEGEQVLRKRLAKSAKIDSIPYGEGINENGVRVSLHPAGHILGSAQVRMEHQGRVVVISGDYKNEPDPTCSNFEPVRCNLFVTESTFALPVYRWPDQKEIFKKINMWWQANQAMGRASLLLGYSLGKGQRLLAGVDPEIGPIFAHPSVEEFNHIYREAGIRLPRTLHVGTVPGRDRVIKALIVAPPHVARNRWVQMFGPVVSAFASGWTLPGSPVNHLSSRPGFPLSDHADWPGILETIDQTGAEEVWAMHGYAEVLATHLSKQGIDAKVVGESSSPGAGDSHASEDYPLFAAGLGNEAD